MIKLKTLDIVSLSLLALMAILMAAMGHYQFILPSVMVALVVISRATPNKKAKYVFLGASIVIAVIIAVQFVK